MFSSHDDVLMYLREGMKGGIPASAWGSPLTSALFWISSYLHSCDPPIIHGNLTCDTIFIQHNGLIKIGSGKAYWRCPCLFEANCSTRTGHLILSRLSGIVGMYAYAPPPLHHLGQRLAIEYTPGPPLGTGRTVNEYCFPCQPIPFWSQGTDQRKGAATFKFCMRVILLILGFMDALPFFFSLFPPPLLIHMKFACRCCEALRAVWKAVSTKATWVFLLPTSVWRL